MCSLKLSQPRAIWHSRIRNGGMACVKWERGTYERVGDRENKVGKISAISVLRKREYGSGGLAWGLEGYLGLKTFSAKTKTVSDKTRTISHPKTWALLESIHTLGIGVPQFENYSCLWHNKYLLSLVIGVSFIINNEPSQPHLNVWLLVNLEIASGWGFVTMWFIWWFSAPLSDLWGGERDLRMHSVTNGQLFNPPCLCNEISWPKHWDSENFWTWTHWGAGRMVFPGTAWKCASLPLCSSWNVSFMINWKTNKMLSWVLWAVISNLSNLWKFYIYSLLSRSTGGLGLETSIWCEGSLMGLGPFNLCDLMQTPGRQCPNLIELLDTLSVSRELKKLYQRISHIWCQKYEKE